MPEAEKTTFAKSWALTGKIFRWLLPRLAIVVTSIPAASGVYNFFLFWFSGWIAFAAAASLELTYISLAAVEVEPGQEGRAKWISVGAAAASVSINSVVGFFQLSGWINETGKFTFVPLTYSTVVGNALLSLLHAIPLVALAWFVSDLLLHAPRSTEDFKQLFADLQAEFDKTVAILAQKERDLTLKDATINELEALRTTFEQENLQLRLGIEGLRGSKAGLELQLTQLKEDVGAKSARGTVNQLLKAARKNGWNLGDLLATVKEEEIPTVLKDLGLTKAQFNGIISKAKSTK